MDTSDTVFHVQFLDKKQQPLKLEGKLSYTAQTHTRYLSKTISVARGDYDERGVLRLRLGPEPKADCRDIVTLSLQFTPAKGDLLETTWKQMFDC